MANKLVPPKLEPFDEPPAAYAAPAVKGRTCGPPVDGQNQWLNC